MGWKIKERSSRCNNCNIEFKEKDIVHSILQYTEDGPLRMDFCPVCWNKGKKDIPRFSYWQVVYHNRPKPAEIRPRIEYYLEVLEERLNSTEEQDRIIVYFLGLILERRKRFISRPSSIKGEMVYEDRETGRIYIINEPPLSTAELLNISTRITRLIEDLVRIRIPDNTLQGR